MLDLLVVRDVAGPGNDVDGLTSLLSSSLELASSYVELGLSTPNNNDLELLCESVCVSLVYRTMSFTDIRSGR
jgi:hypothetical protein